MLFLSFGNRDWPAFAQLVDAFRAELEQRQSAPLHIYLETLDEYQAANDPSFDRTMEQYLTKKYENRKLDLVVTAGNRPLDFVLPRRAKLFPRAKLLYSTVFRKPVPEATGVILQLNLLPTIDIALQQNPGTKRLLLVTGSSPADQTGIPELVEALQGQFRRQARSIEVETLARMTYSEARKYLARLPNDTVSVFLFYFMDSAGQVFTPTRVLPVFSRVSTRPIYSGWDADVGRGSVGGRVISIVDIGQTLALLASRVLSGEDPGKIPPVRAEFQRYMFDWKQMKRWGIRLDQLPADSLVLNREYTAWELYKWYIISGITLILVETGLIVLLFRLRAVKQRAAELKALTAQLSAAFINLPAELVNAEIERGFQRLLDFFRLDCVSLFEVANGPGVRLLCVRNALAASPPAAQLDLSGMPNVMNLLAEGKPLVVSAWTELPAGESALKELMQNLGVVSLATFPLCADGRLFATLTFSSLHPVKWSRDLLQSLHSITDIFGNALARKRADQNLQEAYSQINELRERLEQENVYLREEIKLEHNHHQVIGGSEAIQRVLMQAEQVAATDSTVLLLGETGTGKELIATTIHDLSPRKDRPMVKVNCAALPASLVESELFGREKGAYTGALTREIGRFELANGSTILLDEIGELTMELQSKLLRVLQGGEFERLGSPKTIRVNVRVIAATSRNLQEAVREGKFREDLFYRLNVFPIYIPPLREHREDVPALVWHFVRELGKRMGRNVESIRSSTMKAFEKYSWPGNVRQLRNVIEHALIISPESEFHPELPSTDGTGAPVGHTLEEMERCHIRRVLESTGWRIRGPGGAAEILGLKPTTLESRMQKLGIARTQ